MNYFEKKHRNFEKIIQKNKIDFGKSTFKNFSINFMTMPEGLSNFFSFYMKSLNNNILIFKQINSF
jgi:hypothetical protein